MSIHASDTNRKKIYKLMSILFSNGKSFKYKKQIVILYTTINIFNYSTVNGWLHARLREDMIWNSTANLTALSGGNLALDLVNEFQNNEFKSKFIKTILHFFVLFFHNTIFKC